MTPEPAGPFDPRPDDGREGHVGAGSDSRSQAQRPRSSTRPSASSVRQQR